MSKSSLGFNFYLIQSPTSIGGVLAPKLWRKCSPSSISQSLNSRMKRISQILLSFAPYLDKEASTETSLSMAIQPWESQLKRLILIPSILLKPHSIPQPNNKLTIFAKILPSNTNTFPQTTPMNSPTQLWGPSPPIFPIFWSYHPPP